MTTDKTIEEMNTAIADFMELPKEVQMWRAPLPTTVWRYNHYWVPAGKLKYHEDWNQLMPVVEKISKIKLDEYESHQDVHYPRTFGMPSQDGGVMVRFNCAPVWTAPTLIEATYMAVCDFVQHYTTTKQKD